MSGTRIEPSSAAVLQAVLGFLKNVGNGEGGLPDNAWGYPVHDQSIYLNNDVQYLKAMHALYQLREARSTLSQLLQSSERMLSSLRDATHPAVLARGIEHLPDEVLGHILTLASDLSWKVALRLSWVSQRFRSIALTTPRLWATLPPARVDGTGPAVMMHFLELSKNVGLSVELPLMITEEFERNPDWDEALGMLMEHKRRWKYLFVDFTAIHYEIVYVDGTRSLEKLEFPAATLDAVETLDIADSPHRFLWPDYGSDYERYDDASPEFYASWKFPNLKTLLSDMHIPPPDVFPALTEFSLDLSIHAAPGHYESDDPDHSRPLLDALVDFLNSVPTLQTFKLATGEYEYGPVFGAIHLPSLTTLHMENHYAHPESIRLIRIVSSALHMPTVESISLTISVRNKSELTNSEGACLSWFFPNCESYLKLKRFQLDSIVEHDIASTIIKEIGLFPALEELEIGTSNPTIIAESTATEIREKMQLKRVRFRDIRESTIREYTIGEGRLGE